MAFATRYWMITLVLSAGLLGLSACGSDDTSSKDDGQEGSACLDGTDCDDDLRCVRPTSGEEMGVCSAPTDDREEGESCDAPEQCASGLCHDDQCAYSCIDDTDCPDDRSCDRDEGICEGDEEPEPQVCSSPMDCDDDTTCNIPTFDEDDFVDGAICGSTFPGEGGLGEACTSIDDCESAYCWLSDDETTGECSVFCDDVADCADHQACIDRGPLGVCLAECTTNDDCDGGNVCKLGVNPDEDHVYSYCGSTVGDDTIGDECETTDQCENGVCLAISHYETLDGVTCSENTDCDDGYECACPPDDEACAEPVCVSTGAQTVQRCTDLCDPELGDAACQSDDHDLSLCRDTIEVSWDGVQDTISACTLPFYDDEE